MFFGGVQHFFHTIKLPRLGLTIFSAQQDLDKHFSS